MQKYHALSWRKQIRFFDFEIIINLTGFIAFIVWNVMHFNYWTNIDKTKLDDSDFEKVQVMVNYLNDEDVNIFIIMAVLTSVQWVRSLWVF